MLKGHLENTNKCQYSEEKKLLIFIIVLSSFYLLNTPMLKIAIWYYYQKVSNFLQFTCETWAVVSRKTILKENVYVIH